MNLPRNNGLYFAGLGLLILISFGLLLTPYKLLLVSGRSVNVRLGLLSSHVSNLSVGDYVLLKWRGNEPDPNGVAVLKPGLKLVKRVACLEGQRLRITDRVAECDGKYIGHIRHKNIEGKPITPFYFEGAVPEGYVFLIGDHVSSYDSRYFGPVPQEWLQGILKFWI